jgi:hypothetical protein
MRVFIYPPFSISQPTFMAAKKSQPEFLKQFAKSRMQPQSATQVPTAYGKLLPLLGVNRTCTAGGYALSGQRCVGKPERPYTPLSSEMAQKPARTVQWIFAIAAKGVSPMPGA